jgi:hypothetical protein
MVPSKLGTGWQIWTSTQKHFSQMYNWLSHQHLSGLENLGAELICTLHWAAKEERYCEGLSPEVVL